VSHFGHGCSWRKDFHQFSETPDADFISLKIGGYPPMNSQPDSNTQSDSPEEMESQQTSNSPRRKESIKIKRSSGEYQYVTRKELRQLEKNRIQRRKVRKLRNKTIKFFAYLMPFIIIISGAYWLIKQPFKHLDPPPRPTDLSGGGTAQSPAIDPSISNTTGAIRVLCNVDGATVHVDGGEALGKTKNGVAIVAGITAGIHQVRLKKAGYWISPEFINVEIVSRQATELKFFLAKSQFDDAGEESSGSR
jgi:hypothetical protein